MKSARCDFSSWVSWRPVRSLHRLVAPRAGPLGAQVLVGHDGDRVVEAASIPDSNSSGTSTTRGRDGASTAVAERGHALAHRGHSSPSSHSRSAVVAERLRPPAAPRSTAPSTHHRARSARPPASRTLLGAEQLVHHGVRGQRGGAQLRERVQRGGLPGAEAAGQADEGNPRGGPGHLGLVGLGLAGALRPRRRPPARAHRRRLGLAPRRAPRAPRRAPRAPPSAGSSGASLLRPAPPRRGASSRLGLGLLRPPRRRAGRPRRRCRARRRRRRRGRGRAPSPRSARRRRRPRTGGGSLPATRFTLRESRRRSESISRILTFTSSPGSTTSRGFSTWWWASSEMCTRPSTPSMISTNAPKVTTLVTLPSSSSPSL